MTPKEEKARLRSRFLSRRQSLSPQQVAVASRAILQRLARREEYAGAGLVHTYVSSKDHEVDTLGLIRLSLERHKRVAVPVVCPGTRILRHAQIQELEQLQPGRWGLFEPPADHPFWLEDLAQIELVVVPGVAFDPQGNRLGLGGGYYDRFLALARAPKIGLTHQALLVDPLPVEPHDVPMDRVVTEAAVYLCKEERGRLPGGKLPR